MTMMNGETQRLMEINDDLGRWQFSLRSLMIVVTIASVLLAIGVHFGGITVALIVVGMSLAGILLCADWLIRPANRRALAFVTAASWALVGSAFVIGAVLTINENLVGVYDTTGDALSWSFAISLCGAGILSYYIAIRRWRQLNARRVTNS